MTEESLMLFIFPPMSQEMQEVFKRHLPMPLFNEDGRDIVSCLLENYSAGLKSFMDYAEEMLWLYYSSQTADISDTLESHVRSDNWWLRTRNLLAAFYAEYIEEIRQCFSNRAFEVMEVVNNYSGNGIMARIRLH